MKTAVVSLMVLVLPFAVAAGTSVGTDFDATALSAALPGSNDAEDAAIVADLRRRLPAHMSVVLYAHFVIASPGPEEKAVQRGRRIAEFDAQLRRRHFPDLDTRRILVILGDDAPALRHLAMTLYPQITPSETLPPGIYHSKDRLILATTADGDGAILHALMRALVQDDNSNAPNWLAEAMATLYESSDWRAGRLTPILDDRMVRIAPDEDLAYDVFAGVCDCSVIDTEQLALIRLLLIFLDERGELTALNDAIAQRGRYTTLLQALEAMQLDREAWKAFAERSVRAYWKARGRVS